MDVLAAVVVFVVALTDVDVLAVVVTFTVALAAFFVAGIIVELGDDVIVGVKVFVGEALRFCEELVELHEATIIRKINSPSETFIVLPKAFVPMPFIDFKSLLSMQ